MGSTEYKHGSRRLLVTNGRLPSDHRVANHPITGRPAAVLALVKDKSLKNEATKNDKKVMHP
jgi:hypothetical protein